MNIKLKITIDYINVKIAIFTLHGGIIQSFKIKKLIISNFIILFNAILMNKMLINAKIP
jgi:hypothetical protein